MYTGPCMQSPQRNACTMISPHGRRVTRYGQGLTVCSFISRRNMVRIKTQARQSIGVVCAWPSVCVALFALVLNILY